MDNVKETRLKILSLLPIISEAIVLLFLPPQIPVHYNMHFQVTEYGSKYTLLILGGFVLLFGAFLNWIYTRNKNTEHETIIYRVSFGALLIFQVINLFAIIGSLFMNEGYSFAVIGGADGPTAIFLAGSLGDGVSLFILLGLLILFAVLLFWFRKKKNIMK